MSIRHTQWNISFIILAKNDGQIAHPTDQMGVPLHRGALFLFETTFADYTLALYFLGFEISRGSGGWPPGMVSFGGWPPVCDRSSPPSCP
jgi:hypothetical protein